MKLRQLIEKLIIFIIIVIYITFFALVGIIIKDKDSLDLITEINSYFSMTIFVGCGLMFGIIGAVTNYKLKKYFPTFFEQNRFNLRFAAFGLSVPLIMRGVSDILSESIIDD